MPPETAKKLSDVYAFARAQCPAYKNLPDVSIPKAWSSVPLSTKETFRSAPSLLTYPETEVRYLVSEFAGDHPEELFLIPHRIDAQWTMLESEISEIKPFVGVLAIPLFWQVAPFFYTTFRKHHVPVSVLTPRNLPLAVQLIKETKADMVVSTPEIAAELSGLLVKDALAAQIRAWHLIVPFGQKINTPELHASFFIEYHLFPGIAVARALPGGSWAPLPEFYVEVGERGTCIISSLEKHALPLIRYDSGVPVRRQEEGDAFSFV